MAIKTSTQGQPAYQNKPSSDYIDVEHKEAMRHPTLLKVKYHGFLNAILMFHKLQRREERWTLLENVLIGGLAGDVSVAVCQQSIVQHRSQVLF